MTPANDTGVAWETRGHIIEYAEQNLRNFGATAQKEIIMDWVSQEVGFLTYAEAEDLIDTFGLKEV